MEVDEESYQKQNDDYYKIEVEDNLLNSLISFVEGN